MNEEPQENSKEDLEFEDSELDSVEIADEDIEASDQESRSSKRQAKKEALKHLSPEERKKLRRKEELLIAGGCLLFVVMLLALPFTRWPILNTLGFRSKLVLTINEQKTQKPVFGANLILDGEQSASTDEFGRATFAKAKLGKRGLVASKKGYGSVKTNISNGLGVTKPPVINLRVIGIQLDLLVRDWLSGKPIEGALVKYDTSQATSDQSGSASLVIPPTDDIKVKLEVSSKNYLPKTIETEVNVASREVSLVSSQKNYFISKREGKFDLFSSNLDGSDQRKIIEATGKENQALLQLSINRNNQQALLVSNREGKVKNGRIIAGVYLIDLEKAALRKIDEGSDVQLLDWSDDTIVYTKSVPDLMYDDPSLSKLMAYNLSKSKLYEIAQSNYFQISLVAQSKVFYLPADSYRVTDNSVLTSYDLNTTSKRTYLADRRLAYGTRASYETVELQDSEGKNYELQVERGAVKPIDRQPAEHLQFAIKPGGGRVAWPDRRDGQGALLLRSTSARDEKIIAKAGGLTKPVRFVGESMIVVRIATSQETADYVVDVESGKMAKIVDVSNLGSLMGN